MGRKELGQGLLVFLYSMARRRASTTFYVPSYFCCGEVLFLWHLTNLIRGRSTYQALVSAGLYNSNERDVEKDNLFPGIQEIFNRVAGW